MESVKGSKPEGGSVQAVRYASLHDRLGSMLRVDARRLFRSRFFGILLACSLVIPILILSMVTMTEGSVSVNPQTGKETVMEGFDSVWELIGSVSGTGDGNLSDSTVPDGTAPDGAAMQGEIDMLSMCNSSLLYFLFAVLVCVFVSEDFRSGYAKNLFCVRARKTDYVASKTLVCTLGGALMLLAFFGGTLIGGAVSGVSFAMEGFDIAQLCLCLLSKLILASVFVPIYVLMSVIAKSRLWMSLLLSLMTGMFLFMMIPTVSPLNASLLHPILCLAGGVGFGFGLGAVSNLVLKKTALV